MKLSFKSYFVIGILIVVSVVAVWYFYPKPILYNESFEEGFANWEADADVPPDPNNPGQYVAWNVS